MANDTDPKAFPQDKKLPNTDPIIRQTDCQYSFGKDAITLTLKFLGDTSEAVELASSYRMGTRVNKSTLITDFGKADPKGELSSKIFNGVANSGKVLSSTSQTKTGCGSATVVVEMPYEDRIDIKLTGDNPDMRVVETWSEKSTNHEFPLEVYAGKGDPNAGQLDAWRKMKDQNMNLYSSFKYTVEGQDEPVELKDKTRKLAEKIYRGGEAVDRAYPEVIRTTQYYYVKSGTKDKVDKKVIDELTPRKATGVGTNTTSAAVKLYYRDQTPNSIWKGKFKDFDWLYASYDVECQPTEYQYYWNVTVTESWMGIDTVERGTWDKNLYGEANDRWPFADVAKSKPQGNYDDDAPIEPEDVNGSGRVRPDTFANQSDIKDIDLGTDFHAVDANSFRASSTRGLRLLRSAPPGAPALESITMPSVSFIGDDAFNGAANLQSIALPNRISFLGESVFKDCISMTEAIVEPSIYELPASTFEGCSALNGSQGGTFTVGGLVNTLGEYAFKDCTALTAINCTNALTSIGANAFENDEALTSFTMGLDSTGSITIGDEAFKGCEALADIELPVPTITLGTDSFLNAFDDEVTVKAPKSFLTNLPNTSSYNYIYPAFVTSIAANEWQDDARLTEVYVPETITTLGNNMFAQSALKKAVFNPSATSSGSSTFLRCTSLEELEIGGDTLTTLGANFAKGCTALKSVVITAPVTTFTNGDTSSNGVFNGCSSLVAIYLPDTLTTIGISSFKGCSSLEEMVIPSSVTSIGQYAFHNCTSLKSAIMPENATGSLTLGDSVFNGCSALERVDLPVGTLTVGSSTFSNALASECWIKAPFNSNLVGSIPSGKLVNYIYPSFTTSIAQQEWMSNGNIKSVAIPQGVTEIPYRAFRNCSNLQTAILPEGLTTIGEEAFSRSGLTEINLPSTLTTIAASGLSWCQNMTSITIPDSVTTTGDYFLFNNTSLSSIHIGAGMTSIGREGLAQTAIENLVIPDNITSTGVQSCRSNTHLKTVVCGTGLHSTSYRMFYQCTALESVTFKAALNNSFNSSTFEGCTNPDLEITCEQNTVAQLQGFAEYPFGLTTGQVIHCSDGDITI